MCYTGVRVMDGLVIASLLPKGFKISWELNFTTW